MTGRAARAPSLDALTLHRKVRRSTKKGPALQEAINTRVTRAQTIAHQIRLLELAAIDGGDLPVFAPGAHIDIRLPNGLVRQYSLLNPSSRTDRYLIAVAREENGRGGSAQIHDALAEGDVLPISAPRCHFPLHEEAPHSVLIAGGIGITPIWCMAQRLIEIGASFELHYAARTRGHAALLAEISQAAPDALQTYFNLEGDALMDLPAIAAAAPAGSHFYCCGPLPLIAAYREACSSLPNEQVHFEQFSASTPAAVEGGFTVELAKSGLSIEVASGETILDALVREGIASNYSCREGICGSCETAVLEGMPDHRDAILTDAERADGRTMMICCSGSLGKKLVLDL